MKFAVVVSQENEHPFLMRFEIKRDRLVKMRDLCHEHQLWEVAQTLSDFTHENMGDDAPEDEGVFINSESRTNDWAFVDDAEPYKADATTAYDGAFPGSAGWTRQLLTVDTLGRVNLDLYSEADDQWYGFVGTIEEMLAHGPE